MGGFPRQSGLGGFPKEEAGFQGSPVLVVSPRRNRVSKAVRSWWFPQGGTAVPRQSGLGGFPKEELPSQGSPVLVVSPRRNCRRLVATAVMGDWLRTASEILIFMPSFVSTFSIISDVYDGFAYANSHE